VLHFGFRRHPKLKQKTTKHMPTIALIAGLLYRHVLKDGCHLQKTMADSSYGQPFEFSAVVPKCFLKVY